MTINQTILDVGTESGILAIWSAQAGVRKVYAVEAMKMSEHARALVKANNLQNVVEVIEGSMEDVTLPEKGFPELVICMASCSMQWDNIGDQ
ncbi:protein arginine N-methyltransferase PRMT10-like isoform X3 [Vigna radiata var. radiata]|uniref:Protein arginine N-methyltransferase PRMT10-like isoform X3 n=1 Tax=Vigna radiata var. radiata TaxID=3916 RepID=A0A1S3TEL8_VIGRR|nr:protein arginine N-methyltransferase PRMT10-like isoform X3 [Vigna radiata var. radiata]